MQIKNWELSVHIIFVYQLTFDEVLLRGFPANITGKPVKQYVSHDQISHSFGRIGLSHDLLCSFYNNFELWLFHVDPGQPWQINLKYSHHKKLLSEASPITDICFYNFLH